MAKFMDLDALSYFKSKLDTTFVAQVSGKGLSTNDFTDAYKNKVDAADEKTTAVVEGTTGAYTLKKATSSTVGGVIVGETISTTTGYTKVKIDSTGAIYYADAPALTAATGSALGGVKVERLEHGPCVFLERRALERFSDHAEKPVAKPHFVRIKIPCSFVGKH